ncbi:M24 family metallopeptidase [Saccharopolyspora rhizosphaerae]|uniref:M24 family metallopeptidase n=1 Tax=Saccharopolyspora rhizosphaerae TaxID=2492662 RepID=A0A3R8PB62_9PSEU|nr:M24 family metallopeptidase [Saccharopolyspora rhizosphaerae]
MIELRDRDEIEALEAAGSVAAAVLRAVGEHAVTGVSLAELDEVAREVADRAGARPLGDQVISTSLNDEITGGPPDSRVPEDGDLLSVAVTLHLEGWCTRAATSLVLGTARPQDQALIDATRQALADGIAAAQPGARLGAVCRAIGLVGRSAGYGIPPLGGHGLGRQPRQEPAVPNDGHPGRGIPLRPGLVLSIEPIFTAGGRDHLERDNPIVRTGDESRAAHVGHTLVITDHGPRVLTAS